MLDRLWVFGRQLSWSGGSERGAAVTDREVALLLQGQMRASRI